MKSKGAIVKKTKRDKNPNKQMNKLISTFKKFHKVVGGTIDAMIGARDARNKLCKQQKKLVKMIDCISKVM